MVLLRVPEGCSHTFWRVLSTSNGSYKRRLFINWMWGGMRFKARQSHHRPLLRETTKQFCVRKRARYAFFKVFFSGNQFSFYCRLLYSVLIGALNSSCAHSSRSFPFTFHTIIALILFKLITRQRLKGSYLLPCMCWDPWKSHFFYIPLAGPGTFSTDFGFSAYCSDCLSGTSAYWCKVRSL